MTTLNVVGPDASLGSGRRRRGRRSVVSGVVAYSVLVVLLFWSLIPLLVMISTSFKPGGDIFRVPPTLIPENFTLENYVKIFTASGMPEALLNSVGVGALVTIITMTLGCATGYALARIRFPGSGAIAVGLLLGQLLPVTVLLLPLYQLVIALKIVDTIPGVALTHLTFILPLVTWMANSTFRGVPIELEEAALIDGCNRFRGVWLVVIPIAAPGIAALAIFTFLQSWNEFLFASVVTASLRSKTAPVALTDFAAQFSTDWGAMMAAATVIALPVAIAFLFTQRYFVRGMAAGAVKG